MRTYSEPLVARVTGIPKRVIATHRRRLCAKRVDWQVVGAVVHYTEAGLKKICGALGLDAAALTWPAEAPTSEPPAGVAETAPGAEKSTPGPVPSPGGLLGKIASAVGLGRPAAEAPAGAARVVGAAVAQAEREAPQPIAVTVTAISPNPTIVIGRAAGIDGLVSVKVRSNRNFIPGLVVRATPINGHRYFAQVGRPPRWRGDRVGFTAET